MNPPTTKPRISDFSEFSHGASTAFFEKLPLPGWTPSIKPNVRPPSWQPRSKTRPPPKLPRVCRRWPRIWDLTLRVKMRRLGWNLGDGGLATVVVGVAWGWWCWGWGWWWKLRGNEGSDMSRYCTLVVRGSGGVTSEMMIYSSLKSKRNYSTFYKFLFEPEA